MKRILFVIFSLVILIGIIPLEGATAENISSQVVIEDFSELPYNIYKTAQGSYITEDIFSTREESFTEYFIDTVNGADTNSGLTRADAFRTLKQAQTAALGKAFIITIINDNVVLFADELYGEFPMEKTGMIRAEGTATLLGGIKNPGFLPAAGYENTYVSTDLSNYSIQSSIGVSGVVDTDERNLDAMGLYRALTPVNSATETEGTDGSYYFDSDTGRMYVNPVYGIETVHPLLATYPFRFNLKKAKEDTMLYLKNLNVIGGFYMTCRSDADETDTRKLEFVADNCIFQHNIRHNAVSVRNFNISYMIDCKVGYSLQDGYNYHAEELTYEQRISAIHVEVNCQAEECGYYRMMFGVQTINNNLSTAHEGVNMLRLNFTGRSSFGPQIADVNGCHTVCIDCNISNDYQFTGGSKGNYHFNQSSATRSGKATLINCYASDVRAANPRLYSSVDDTTVQDGNMLEGKYSVKGELTILPSCTHTYENGVCIDCGVVQPGPVIIKQPANGEALLGQRYCVSVEAKGEELKYQWYFRNAGSKTWQKSSVKDNTYDDVMNEERAEREVYCVITDASGNSVTTDTVKLICTSTKLEIILQPESIVVVRGATDKVKLEAVGDGLSYTWYYKNADSSVFRKTSSFTGNTYAVKMNDERAGRQIYCVITDQYGNSVQSDTVTLAMGNTVHIMSQPQDVSVKNGARALVTLEATGDGLTYSWYYKNADSSVFRKTSSFTGNSYSVKMNEERADRQVYCVVTDRYGNSVQSDTVTLAMGNTVHIMSQPQDVSVKNGARALVTLEATGDGLTYSWYYKNADSSVFRKTSSFTGNSYSVKMNEERAGRQIYCVITDAFGNQVTTDIATLEMIK